MTPVIFKGSLFLQAVLFYCPIITRRRGHMEPIRYERIDELSDRTGLKKSWWYRETRKKGPGSVPKIKVGKHLLFIPAEVDEWLRSKGRGAA